MNNNDHLQGFIPAGLTILQGSKGSVQSILALNLALTMAQGADWNGYDYDPQTILYITGLGTWFINGHARAWLTHHGVTKLPPTFTPLSHPLNLVASPKNFIRDVRKAGIKPDMIVFDPLSSMIGATKLNVSSAVSSIIANTAEIMRELDCSVMLVSDVGSMGVATVLMDASVDADLRVMQEGSNVTVHVRKMRDGVAGGSFSFEQRMVDGRAMMVAATCLTWDHLL